jgi:hypothetical protein
VASLLAPLRPKIVAVVDIWQFYPSGLLDIAQHQHDCHDIMDVGITYYLVFEKKMLIVVLPPKDVATLCFSKS